MSRYLVPAAFFAATAWVGWYNRTHGTSKVVLPMIDVVWPGDPQQLGERSMWIVFGAGVVLLAMSLYEHVQAARKARNQDP